MTIAFYVLIGVTIISWILWAFAWDQQNQRWRTEYNRAETKTADAQRLQKLLEADQEYISALYLERNQMFDQLHPPANMIDDLHNSQLLDIMTQREADDLEAAAGAWYRLKECTLIELSAKPDGTGPLFSSSKGAVADRALQIMMGNVGADDWAIVERWLDQHPGQFDKLNGELG